jgi:hypothetical protein
MRHLLPADVAHDALGVLVVVHGHVNVKVLLRSVGVARLGLLSKPNKFVPLILAFYLNSVIYCSASSKVRIVRARKATK